MRINTKKYIVGNVYRRPSGLSADLSQFRDEFTEVLNKVHASSRQAYINGDFNIVLWFEYSKFKLSKFTRKIRLYQITNR